MLERSSTVHIFTTIRVMFYVFRPVCLAHVTNPIIAAVPAAHKSIGTKVGPSLSGSPMAARPAHANAALTHCSVTELKLIAANDLKSLTPIARQ